MTASKSLRLFRIFQDVVSGVRTEYESHDRLANYSTTELNLLLAMEVPLSMGDVARALHCQPSNVTALVDGLEEKGLLRRQPHPEDRRAKQLILTKKGMKERAILLKVCEVMFREVTGLSSEAIDRILACFDSG